MKRCFFIGLVCWGCLASVLLSATCRAADGAQEKTRLAEMYYRSQIRNTSLPVPARIEAYDSLIAICADRQDTVLWRLYEAKAKEQEKSGGYASALLSYQKALWQLDSLGAALAVSSEKRGFLLYNMARMSVNAGLYDQASKYLYQVMADTGVSGGLRVRSCSLLGAVYINLNNFQVSASNLGEARKIIENSPGVDTLALFDYASIMGGWYYGKHIHDSALWWMEQAAVYAAHCDLLVLMIYNYNVASIYLDMGERELAKKSLLQVLSYCEKSDEALYMCAVATQNLASIYFLEENYPLAKQYYGMALASAEACGAKHIVSGCYLELADVYKTLGDCETAWHYQRSGYRLKDSVAGSIVLEEMLAQNNAFESLQRELEKRIIVQELLVSDLRSKNKTIVLSVLCVLLLFFIAILIVSLRKMRSQKKTNASLHETLERTASDIDLKNRTLTKNALMLAHADEMFTTLRDGIKKLKTLNANAACKEVIDGLNVALATYQGAHNWEEFALYFEEVHPSFFKKLKEVAPGLTLNEQRICALIYLNLNAKQIASLTFRSVRTVETVIHNIRKKLNIPLDEKTQPFLENLMADTLSAD